MVQFKRSGSNPLLKPNPDNLWEAQATFNGCVIKDNLYHIVYRSLSSETNWNGKQLAVSTIGYAKSKDGVTFTNRRKLIAPEMDWEKYGCEDPRITKVDDEYFVFYTALSDYPFYAGAIKIAVACFTDFNGKIEKHLVTPFNSKAMALFPKKIKGKYAALLTTNTDLPPSKICLAFFDNKEDIWSQTYWNKWYRNLEKHTLPLQRINSDQLEIGAPPVLTKKGWLLIYSHIQHYYNPDQRIFGIEAVLLDKNDPHKILARTDSPIMIPEEEYELKGNIPNIVFPSGAVLKKNTVSFYYGATDTTCCLAKCSLKDLLKAMNSNAPVALKVKKPLRG